MKNIKKIISPLIIIIIFTTIYFSWKKGYKLYMVLSGSMEPKIKTGSVVLVQPMNVEELNVGDIINFKSDLNNLTTTHRIIEISEYPEILITTKGDANDIEDPIKLRSDQVIGKIIMIIPYLGYVAGFLQTRFGLLVSIGAPILFGLIYYILQKILDKKSIKEVDHLD